jgi:D-lactate dehydrogenase
VCSLDEGIARSNADTRGPPPCRSEGKVLLLASVHDTFPQPVEQRLLWVGCSSFAQAAAVRRLVLSDPHALPTSCEYMGRDAVDVVDEAGRVSSRIMQVAGMKRMAPLWDLKVSLLLRESCES